LLKNNIKVLYKYRGFNENTLSLLTKNVHCFSAPKYFNDPFDAFIENTTTFNKKQLKKYFKNISNGINKYKTNDFEYKLFDEEQLDTTDFRILSLSKAWNNQLMWSHYANNQTGICIGFKIHQIAGENLLKCNYNDFILENEPFLKLLFDTFHECYIPVGRVLYTKNRIGYNILNENLYSRILMAKSLFYKNKDWKYEQEYRSVIPKENLSSHLMNDDERSLIRFDPKEICEITFGLLTSESDKKTVYDIVKQYENGGNWIKFYQCKMIKNKFAVERISC